MYAIVALCGFVLSADPAEAKANAANEKQPAVTQAAPAEKKPAAAEKKPATDKPVTVTANKPVLAEPEVAKTEATEEEDADKLHPIEESVIKLTNYQRARYGLPELEVDRELMTTAREHCNWMSWFRRLQHTNRPVAENIAMGQPSSEDALNSWMNSSGHRANILNSGYRRIGVGVFQTHEGQMWWCQQFR